jgi:ketosteroid isomerase-like protein
MANPSLEEMREDVMAWTRRDFDVAFRHWHEDVEWYPDVMGSLEGRDAYRGHEGLRRWAEALDDVFDRVETEISEVRDLGSRMVVLGTTRVYGKGSGMAVEEPLAFVLEMRDGKVARAVSYRDHAKALEAADE